MSFSRGWGQCARYPVVRMYSHVQLGILAISVLPEQCGAGFGCGSFSSHSLTK